MPGVNLLPWRERRRQLRIQRQQGLLLAAGLITLLFVWRVDAFAREALQRQVRADASTRELIDRFDAQLGTLAQHKVEHERIRDSLQALGRLQGSRLSRVDLLEHLAGAVPQGVHLTALTAQGARLQVKGLAHSGSLLAQMLRNLSRDIGAADLQQVRAVDAGEAFELTLVVRAES